jgi:acetyltransferase-like isoleucine patch superfamily enzyme
MQCGADETRSMATIHKDGTLFDFVKRNYYKRLVAMRFPLPRFLARFIFKERTLRNFLWSYFKSKLYNENLLRYRCAHVGKRLMVLGSFMLEGDGDVYIGNDCIINSNVCLFVGRHIIENAEIRIGDNCIIGCGASMEAARSIRIGNNCVIGDGTRIMDNDSHPLSVDARRKKLKPPAEMVKPVIIEDDVRIGERCIIMKGVTIGQGSIIVAGSIVIQSVKPMSIVMNVPARAALWVPGHDANNE